jgi:hypothetical protein
MAAYSTDDDVRSKVGAALADYLSARTPQDAVKISVRASGKAFLVALARCISVTNEHQDGGSIEVRSALGLTARVLDPPFLDGFELNPSTRDALDKMVDNVEAQLAKERQKL